MPRPTTATTGATGDFGPSQYNPEKLQVVAPLNVTAGPTDSEGVANALAGALGLSTQVLGKKVVQEGADQATQGSTDAQSGNVNQEEMKRSQAYALGATTVIAQKHFFAARDTFLQQANDPSNPLFNMPHDQLAKAADQFLAQQLGGLEKDPTAARAIAGQAQHFVNEVAGQRLQRDVQNTQKQALANAQDAASVAAELAVKNHTLFNYSEYFNTVKQTMGGDGVGANLALVDAILSRAVADHNPKIPDLIPDQVLSEDGKSMRDGPARNPQIAQLIAAAKQRIQGLLKSDYTVVNQKAQMDTMQAILAGHNPRTLLQQYAAIPYADPAFVSSAMGFYHSLTTNRESDALDSGAAAEVTADIAALKITSPQQLLQRIQLAGYTGKAATQLLSKGLTTLKAVQSTSADDPNVRDGVTYVDQLYRQVNPITGRFLSTAAATQHAGAMLDFREEVQKLIGSGKSPEEAVYQTMQSVKKKWGDPVEAGMKATSSKLPATDADQAMLIKNFASNPNAVLQSNITGTDIMRLRATGFVSDAEAAAVATFLHTHKYGK